MFRSPWRVAILVGALIQISCSHSMEIRNLDAYVHQASAPRELTLVVAQHGNDQDLQDLGTATIYALQRHSSVGSVAVANEAKDVAADAYVSVTPKTEYGGSGWNFLITFPGFLLFTHAWNGFLYEATVTTDVSVRTGDSERVVTKTIETKYDLRYCDLDRGFVTSSGWYTPFWGGLNILFGVYMINYDSDGTVEFVREVGIAYGDYIANSIVEMTASELPPVDGEPAEPTCATYNRETRRFESGCAPELLRADGA